MRKTSTRKQKKPRKPTLSPTKINTYLACQVMYKYTYVLGISRFYYQPKLHHSFGLSLHRTLEEFHKEGGAKTQSPDELVEKLHQTWTSLGYSSEQEEQQHLEAATHYMQEYHSSCQPEGVKTLFTEKQLRHDMGDFILMGRVDRIDEHPDGRLEIVDYKSGRLSVEEDEVRNDLAMRIYAYLGSKVFPDRKISASIYCIRTCNTATVEFSQEELDEIEDGVRAIAEELLRIDENSDIEPVWLPNVCPGCDYLRLCARKMGWNVQKLIEETSSN